MEYTLTQLIALAGGTALCLLAVAIISPMTRTRATEALLDRIELALARRARRRAGAAAAEAIHVSVFEAYRPEGAHC